MDTLFSKLAIAYIVSELLDRSTKEEYDEHLNGIASDMEINATPEEFSFIDETIQTELVVGDYLEVAKSEDILAYLSEAIGPTSKFYHFTAAAIEKIQNPDSSSGDSKLQAYLVPVSWELGTELRIIASSPDEALQKALDHELPDDGEYLDGSYKISAEYFEEELKEGEVE